MNKTAVSTEPGTTLVIKLIGHHNVATAEYSAESGVDGPMVAVMSDILDVLERHRIGCDSFEITR